jgi:predicted nucleotidyltransferase
VTAAQGDRGLDADGHIVREGALDQVAAEFAPVVEAVRRRVPRVFGDDRLHSAYLYGSIPRGTAVPGVSDLDVLLALRAEPTGADWADARALEAALDAAFPQIDGAGLLVFSVGRLLSEGERYDLGWFVACLTTPLLGADLAERLPRYRPTSLLARETNGGLARDLPALAAQVAASRTAGERRRLCRGLARRLVRTAFTLVMPRWGGWIGELDRMAEIAGTYYPERAGQLRSAARLAREPSAEPAALEMLAHDLAPWLAEEYRAWHGEKAPRGALPG